MNKSMCCTICLVALGMCSATAWAGASRDEAKAFCVKAAAHEAKVGTEQALKDFNFDQAKTNGWYVGDMYVFGIDGGLTVIAHGANAKLVGKNLKMMKGQDQADGTKGSYFMREMLKIAETGARGGEFSYNFITPKTNQNRKKVSWVYAYTDKRPGYFGCGYYV